jgi:hypothetical protein
MQKFKDSHEITKLLFEKTFLDVPHEDSASEYMLFVKDMKNTPNKVDDNNNLSLVIIDKNSGYVVNNDIPFNSLEMEDSSLKFYKTERKNPFIVFYVDGM